jgi:hypothetical protein
MLATLALPFSATDLCEAVRHARPFNPAGLDRVLRMDASRGLVEVQASASWARLAAYLRPGAADFAAAWTGLPTIGESLATNAPGPDGRPIAEHVESLTLVTPDGELRRVNRESAPELFALAIGGQGLFGAIYSATLRLESLARAAADAAPALALQLPAAGCTTRSLHLLSAPEHLEACLAEIRKRCAEWRVAIEGVTVRRTLPESESKLRWAQREYALISLQLAQPPALGGAVRSTQLCRELIDTAIAHGGGFPIACTPEATRAQTERCYPAIRGFLAEKRRFDPACKLDSPWYRHMRSLFGRDVCEAKWNR